MASPGPGRSIGPPPCRMATATPSAPAQQAAPCPPKHPRSGWDFLGKMDEKWMENGWKMYEWHPFDPWNQKSGRILDNLAVHLMTL